MPASNDRFVHLQRGLVVPLEAYRLVLDMERRGYTLRLDGNDVLVNGDDIRPADIEQLRRLKPHLRLLLAYVANDQHLFDDHQPRPEVGPILISLRRQWS